jgi:hypothetical protein
LKWFQLVAVAVMMACAGIVLAIAIGLMLHHTYPPESGIVMFGLLGAFLICCYAIAMTLLEMER